MQVIKITSTGLARTGHTMVESISLIPGSAVASVVLNDSLDGSGTDKGAAKTDATYSTESTLNGQSFATGVYVTLVGTGAVVYIYIR